MTGLEITYLICFFLGLGFAVISALLSGVFAGDVHGHVDTSGAPDVHADAGPHDGGVHFSPLSPVTVSMFLATFGGTGIICKRYFNMTPELQIPIASVSGIVVAILVGWLMYGLVKAASANTLVRIEDLIGRDAEVSISIPREGMGQIVYVQGGRQTAPARTSDNSEIPSGSVVKIVRMVGNTFFVERMP